MMRLFPGASGRESTRLIPRKGTEMKKDGSQNHYEQGRCSLLLMLCLVALALASRTAMGQVDQGAITGIVQDSSGAIFPNARVTVTNIYTGLVLQGTTNRTAVYV